MVWIVVGGVVVFVVLAALASTADAKKLEPPQPPPEPPLPAPVELAGEHNGIPWQVRESPEGFEGWAQLGDQWGEVAGASGSDAEEVRQQLLNFLDDVFPPTSFVWRIATSLRDIGGETHGQFFPSLFIDEEGGAHAQLETPPLKSGNDPIAMPAYQIIDYLELHWSEYAGSIIIQSFADETKRALAEDLQKGLAISLNPPPKLLVVQ